MAEKKNEKLGASFTLPEPVTVRQQLSYFSEASLAYGEDLWFRLWRGALKVVGDWKCDLLPDPNIDLDDVSDPKITEVIFWASMEVKQYMDGLDRIPKN
jgi:hypothetical protein